MRYADNVDEYLQNQPHPMIRHCPLKKGLGENMDNARIRVTSVGEFSVCYYKNGEKLIYSLDFGDFGTLLLLSRLENVGLSMQAFFCSFQKISSIGLEFLISVVSKIANFNFG